MGHALRILCLGALVGAFGAVGSARAIDLHPPFGAVPDEAIRTFLLNHPVIDGWYVSLNEVRCNLWQNAGEGNQLACQFRFGYPSISRGKWSVKDGLINFHTVKDPCRGYSCRSHHKFPIKALGPSAMFAEFMGERRLFACLRGDAHKAVLAKQADALKMSRAATVRKDLLKGAPPSCRHHDGPAVLVKASEPSGSLFKALLALDVPPLEKVNKYGDPAAVFFDGGRADKALKRSQLYYRDAKGKAQAVQLAERLRPALGEIAPERWRHGGVYEMVLTVGTGKPGALKLELRDGHCKPGQAASRCSNPQLETIEAVLAAGSYSLSRGKPANKSRQTTEVWYKPGLKQSAEKLVEAHLSKWLQSSAVREWTWGGDFDLLIIVGPPTP